MYLKQVLSIVFISALYLVVIQLILRQKRKTKTCSPRRSYTVLLVLTLIFVYIFKLLFAKFSSF